MLGTLFLIGFGSGVLAVAYHGGGMVCCRVHLELVKSAPQVLVAPSITR